MPSEPTPDRIHTGDVSGTFIVGDNNHVTNTKTESPEQPQPHQRNSAEDHAAVFAVEHGTMRVTYNAAPAPAPDPDGEDRTQP
ncbi:hypothetical protein [Streptomyces sp. NRRL WC-3742]|uniref:hypothetical protein n=1 Tax=Streptomyces sp. NRRL WC-3742 TaxID=1463934 RepID=UPI0004C66659|nr:hypothetical protein [Streptomyces sp. NRRL WC-3742]